MMRLGAPGCLKDEAWLAPIVLLAVIAAGFLAMMQNNAPETSIPQTGQENLRRGSTDNAEAWEAYLKGRAAYRRWTRQDNETALAFYQRAAALDPGFALAVAGAANAHALRATEFGLGEEWIDEVIFNIAELLQILGRWDQAVKYQQLDTNRPQGLERLSIYLRNLGFDQRAATLARQFEQDLPVSFSTDANLSLHDLLDGEFERARMAARRMQRSVPGAAGGWLREGEIDLFAGDLLSAEKNFLAAVQTGGGFQNYANLRLAHV